MFRRVVEQLRVHHTLAPKRVRMATVLTPDNIITILAYFEANPTKAITDAVDDLGFTYGSIQKALKRNGFKAFKVMPVMQLRERDFENRMAFCRTMLRINEENPNFISNIIFTDESCFSTAGRHNRRNTHYWSMENPHRIAPIERQGYQTTSVWCGMWRDRILGPLFYQGALTGERYLGFLENEINNFMANIPPHQLGAMVWQQDGAPAHGVRPVTDFLNQRYPQWIGKNGTVRWPPRSPDLTELDFFLWGHLQGVVYDTTPNTLDVIRLKIVNEINRLNENPEILFSVRQNFKLRLQLCLDNNGRHIEHLMQDRRRQ